jgi:TPR repeat protein
MDTIIRYIETNDNKSLYKHKINDITMIIKLANISKDQFKIIEKYANDGQDIAEYIFGKLYYYGYYYEKDYCEKDQDKSFKYYELSAKQGNIYAIYGLGVLYRLGNGCVKDNDKSFKCFEFGAFCGNAESQYELGFMYLEGDGCNKDLNKAFKYIELSADQKYIFALNQLGNMYNDGTGCSQDYDKAFQYYLLAAQQHNSAAQSNLGRLYYEGKGCSQDYDKSFEYFKLSIENADDGDTYNEKYIKKIYEDEKTPKEVKKKIKIFLKDEIKNNRDLSEDYGFSNDFIKILKQKIKLEELQKEIKELRLHIDLSPDGSLYLDTKKHFEELINK